MSKSGEAAKFARSLRRLGWTIEICGSTHYKATHPDNGAVVVFSYSPSDSRWLNNARADVKRANKAAKK